MNFLTQYQRHPSLDPYVSACQSTDSFGVVYRVAPKKINDPDDPTTWEKGVAILRRDSNSDSWVLDTFKVYSDNMLYKYRTEHGTYRYAKLATPELIEAWKLINGDV